MSTDFEKMNHGELKTHWTKVIGQSPPTSSSVKFLRRAMAHERQSKKVAGLTRSELKQLSDSLKGDTNKRTSSRTQRQKVQIVRGSRLIREWNSRSYIVSVTEDGFVYRGKVWSSLSAIARDITGAHWSGPRFFGVSGSTQ